VTEVAVTLTSDEALVEPFEGNYRELVDYARQRLAERGGT
jgi:hypothetical protein